MKYLVPNYSCLQNPWLGGYHPQILILFVLCPQLNLLNPPPNKIPGYATDHHTYSDILIYNMQHKNLKMTWLRVKSKMYSTKITSAEEPES